MLIMYGLHKSFHDFAMSVEIRSIAVLCVISRFVLPWYLGIEGLVLSRLHLRSDQHAQKERHASPTWLATLVLRNLRLFS